jgi:predicted dehydrogenase
MNVAIIGAGLQCRRRAPVVKDDPSSALTLIASLHAEHAREAARTFGCGWSADWREVVARPDVDIVLVCTPPHVHAEISLAALAAGKHVLCEKPLTRTVAEAEALARAAAQSGRIFKCGFNHRHHPAIREAHAFAASEEFGKPLFARCRYGICGRPGYEREWRADPAQAAGGQFIEQGTHGLDLFRWFLGPLVEAAGMTSRQYFTRQPLDEGGMAVFRSACGATASLHTSLTQWRNLFSFEVYGENGYVEVEGLGASYGLEKLTLGRREFDGPFTYRTIEFRGPDVSWKEEWREFLAAIREGRPPLGSAEDGLAAMRLGLAVYESESTGRIIRLDPPA